MSRVAAAFNNNGQGVRGDMKAVVNAILIDPEARAYVKIEPGSGKLREPVLYVAAAARMLGTQSDGDYPAQQAAQLGQPLFYPASVFNYYPPTYRLPGTTQLAPEFATANSSTSINRYNFGNGLSDFGRTLQPASGGGTDHAWGNHHFIIGDAVRGGAIYGQYPELLLGGPSAAETEGRGLPTTAVEQYGATLAQWFAVAPQDLGFAFPNLANFASADLGFIG